MLPLLRCSFVGSLLQVRRVESHWLWSYGLGDKVLNIWRQDSRISGSRDASELLAMAQAANRLYEVRYLGWGGGHEVDARAPRLAQLHSQPGSPCRGFRDATADDRRGGA